jgi:hypothetical protein
MKKIVLMMFVLLMLLVPMVYAGAFDGQDKEANQVAIFLRSMLGGEQFEKTVLTQHPGSKITWGGRLVNADFPKSLTYLIYCEASNQKEPLYYYYELKITAVNANPELVAKYGLK